jgi:hypothetical protein
MPQAGGPINGSGLYGPVALARNPAATIIVPTMLQIATDTVSQFAGLTCLYNRNWYNRQDIISLPLCFFYIKDISETRETQISQKRVLIYEPQMTTDQAKSANFASPLRPGVQEVIADNMVIKPKTYQLDIVLPFQLASGQFNRQMNDLAGMFEGFIEIFSGQSSYQSFFTPAQALVSLGNNVLSSAAKLPNSASAAYINKNSLDAMAESQTILTLKMWTGYDYKYVVITGVDIKKSGKEDDVFRAVLKLQEVPVLTVNPVTDVTTPGGINRNWAATAISFENRALTDPLAALTGIKQASLLPGELIGALP